VICSYVTYKESGPSGTSFTIRTNEEENVTTLGTIDGVTFIHTEEPLLLDQPNEISFQSDVELTEFQKEELKTQSYIRMKKDVLRDKLDSIGDLHDMVADCMKLIEFNIMLTSRLAADYLGTSEMSDLTKQTYSARNQLFLDSVESGDIKIRGNIEDVDKMFGRLMVRYTQIQTVVEDYYISELKRVGLS